MNNISHPITNGSTKLFIFISLCFVGGIGALDLVFTFVLKMFGDLSIVQYICAGVVAGSCVGIFGYAIKSFFDTREAHEKAKWKLEKKKLKNEKYETKCNIRLELYKIRKNK